jgi:membrane protease YdiL (CAAX protease family)
MQSETLFRFGFIFVSAVVLSTVAVGCAFWIRWFRGVAKANLCGDRSPDLITRLSQPSPRWTVFDFFIMFGVMIFVGSMLLQSAGLPEASSVDSPQGLLPPTDGQANMGLQSEIAAADPNRPPEPNSLENLIETKIGTDAESVPSVGPIRVHLIATLAALVCTLAYLRLIHGATLSHLSLIPTKRDIRRGLVATVWILSPVLIINLIISNLVKYEHPVTDLLAQQSNAGTFLLLFFSAAVVTPIAEELQFRLLLQGGLQQLADPPPPRQTESSAPSNSSWQPLTAWPVYVTSLIFGLLHYGQGAAPIPLFFLSLGLGFLYQRTGRLVPAIVVHMMLNGATLCMEFCRANAMFEVGLP